MRSGGSQSLKKLVSNLLKELNGKEGAGKRGLLDKWHKIVGKKAALHSKPASLRKGRLTVSVDSSSWLYELNSKKLVLLEKTCKIFGDKKIKEIAFRIGNIN